MLSSVEDDSPYKNFHAMNRLSRARKTAYRKTVGRLLAGLRALGLSG